jgi:hypothetical protein
MTLRSTCDTNVDPSVSAELAGADNRMTPTCIGHASFPSDTGVFTVIKNAILANTPTTTTTTTTSGTTTTPTTGTTTPTSGQPPYSEKVTATAVDHYLAKRVTVAEYNTLGARYGYNTPFPLYHCAAGWTDKFDCAAL